MTKSENPKSGIASFRAEILWMLQPIVEYSRLPHVYRGFDAIVVEPCAEGGAIIAAVSGHAMAVFRDPNGTCSTAMTLGIPDAMFKACAPLEPICMNYCGEHYECRLPEWAQPDLVVATTSGTFVNPKMRHPDWAEEDGSFYPALYSTFECGNHYYVGEDYKWTAGSPINWRKPLDNALAGTTRTTGTYPVNPMIPGLFDRIANRIADIRQEGVSTFHRYTQSPKGEPWPTVVTLKNYPDFVGAYMPQKTDDYQEPALWFQKRVGERIGGVQ